MEKLFRQATLLRAAATMRQLPRDQGIEVAFAGRSNAGKSSAINLITGNGRLARTSKTPGRTQQLLFFEFAEQRRLVDLPGYGYARVPAAMRKNWINTMNAYFQSRNSLAGVMLVMDVRRPFRELDQQMFGWLDAAGIPVHILLTKADKLGRSAASRAMLDARRYLDEKAYQATVQLFSASRAVGRDEALAALVEMFQQAANAAEITPAG